MRARPEHSRREILYCRHAVHESLRAGRRKPHKLILAEGIRQTDVISQIVSLAEQAGVKVERAERRNLDQIGNVHHQGVALKASPYPYITLNDILVTAQSRAEPPLLLLLDQLQDPQNVGSLLRTAEVVGIHGVVIQRRRAVSITPAVVHASAGAAEHLKIAQVTNLVNEIGNLPVEIRERLEPTMSRVVDSSRRRRRILQLVQDALSQLRLDMKYLMFDLEATRRERDDYRRQIEGN